MSIILQFQQSRPRGDWPGGPVSYVSEPFQSVGGERRGRGLQGAGRVGASHVRQEVGVRAQLVDVKPVLLAVRQAAPDERLGLCAGLGFGRKLHLCGFEDGVFLENVLL